MAIFTTDLSGELQQLKAAADDVIRNSVNPALQQAIRQAGDELNAVVEKAGDQVERSITALSHEIHNQRQITGQELKELVDYAASKLDKTIDVRFQQVRAEASQFIEERVAHLKKELDDAAVKSRRTLYANMAVSVAAALGMAVIGLVYKKISLGELDLFATFRVLLLATAAGTGVFSVLRAVQSWLVLNRAKRNLATVVLEQASMLRPNGALGLFLLTLALAAAWYVATFHA